MIGLEGLDLQKLFLKGVMFLSVVNPIIFNGYIYASMYIMVYVIPGVISICYLKGLV